MPRSPSLKRTSPFTPARNSFSRRCDVNDSCRGSARLQPVAKVSRRRLSLDPDQRFRDMFFDSWHKNFRVRTDSRRDRRQRRGRSSTSSFGFACDLIQQRLRDPELIEASGILDTADARIRTRQGRKQRHLHRFAIGVERQRQRPFPRIAARLRCGQKIDIADRWVECLGEARVVKSAIPIPSPFPSDACVRDRTTMRL